MNIISKLLELFKKSANNPWGGISSTRVSAYFLLLAIFAFAITTLGIEISTAIVALMDTGKYVLSNEFIVVLGLFLSHHLTLLGINQNNETKQLNNENKKSTPSSTTTTQEVKPNSIVTTQVTTDIKNPTEDVNVEQPQLPTETTH